MYANREARRLEHLTVVLALVVVAAVASGALVGARALSDRLGAGTLAPGDPAAKTAAVASTVAAGSTVPTVSPALAPIAVPTTVNVPSFSTSTVSSVPSASQLQIAGQAVTAGAKMTVTVAVQLSAAGKRLAGQSVTIVNNGHCVPGQWRGISDGAGHAGTVFSCAPTGPDVVLSAASGPAKVSLILHR